MEEPICDSDAVSDPTTVEAAARRTSYKSPVVVLGCVLLQGICLAWTFLAMRAVMNVGGACADGGPYLSAQPCPDGAALIAVAIPVLIISAMVGSVAAISIKAPNLLLPMWAVLFGSLGWNFLEFAFSTDQGIVWGWLVCGVLFELMALPAILAVLQGIREMIAPPPNRTTPTGSPWWAPAYSLLGSSGLLAGWWSFHALS